jgi:NADH-quinone oxidoreductase subunit H
MIKIIIIIIKVLTIIIPVLIAVAFFTVAERKIMGAIQRRRGPNVIGFMGLLQALADGLKLFVKETTLPSNSNLIVFILAPMLSFILSLISWAVIPFSNKIVASRYKFRNFIFICYFFIKCLWNTLSRLVK